MAAEKTWYPCPDHAMMEATLARLDERSKAQTAASEQVLAELKSLNRRLGPVELQVAREQGVESERDITRQIAPKWASAKIAGAALVLSLMVTLASLALVVFSR